jgi:multiple sugar transport system ATP-binding protein
VVIEPLGAETLVTFSTDGGEIIARLPPEVAYAPGDDTEVFLDMDKCHAFDQATGVAL